MKSNLTPTRLVRSINAADGMDISSFLHRHKGFIKNISSSFGVEWLPFSSQPKHSQKIKYSDPHPFDYSEKYAYTLSKEGFISS